MKHAANPAEHNRSRFICFYAHGRGTELQNTPLGLFRSLLHQLLQLTPNLLSSFASLYQGKLETRGNFEESWTWQLTELKDLFKSYVLGAVKSQPLQIYVDALDEAGEDAARSLIAYFQQISTRSPNSKLAIYFSCRHYPILTSRDNPSISMEEENYNDIATYVRNELNDCCGDRLELDKISKEIVGRAVGVFLWVTLVLPTLVRMFEYGKSIKVIHKKLHEIPTALNDVYANILNLIEIEDRPQTLKLMQWVCFARRPLSIMELRYAMMVDDDVIGERFDGDCTTLEAHAKTERPKKTWSEK